MTRIELEKRGIHYSLSVKGHAGYSDVGKDIVCSACSILAYSAVQEIQNLDKKGMLEITEFHMEEGNILIAFDLYVDMAIIVLDTVMEGYRWLAENYQKNLCIHHLKGEYLQRLFW